MPNTVRLHRVLATKPDKVYRAFIEADALAKWLPPNGFACTVHNLDAKVGGNLFKLHCEKMKIIVSIFDCVGVKKAERIEPETVAHSVSSPLVLSLVRPLPLP